MAIILGIATILGGIAAIWFFWDKIAAWWQEQHQSIVVRPTIQMRLSNGLSI